MIENWAYAALAEHIYRRNQGSDQALREAELSQKGGLAGQVLPALNTERILALRSLGFSVSEDRYIYNPDAGFEATIAQGADGELVVVFRGMNSLDGLPHPRQPRSAARSARIACASPPTGRPGGAFARQA